MWSQICSDSEINNFLKGDQHKKSKDKNIPAPDYPEDKKIPEKWFLLSVLLSCLNGVSLNVNEQGSSLLCG
jgi:hypothetical protein